VLGALALRASGGPAVDTPFAMGYLLGGLVLPTIVTGFWAWQSSSAWPLWRTIVTFIAVLGAVGVLQGIGKRQTSAEDDAAYKAKAVADMRKSYAEAARRLDAPSFVDTLEARFPGDFNTFMEKLIAVEKSGKRLDAVLVQTEISDLRARILARDGERVRSAPAASLKAVIAALRGQVAAFRQDKPELCTTPMNQTQAQQFASAGVAPGITRSSMIYLNALYQAIADGRDKPIAARAVENGDYVALARNARSRGMDIGSWSLLRADAARTAAPIAVCDARLSAFDAMLSEPDALGERILADQASQIVMTTR
jgi:hypothetical protein